MGMKINLFTALIFGAALGIMTLVNSIILSYRASQELYTNFNRIEHTHQVMDKLKFTVLKLHECEGNVRGYALSGNLDFLLNYQESVDSIRKELINLKNLTADNNPQQRKIDSLNLLIEKRIQMFVLSIEAAQPGTADLALMRAMINESRILTNQIVALKNRIQYAEQQKLFDRQQRAYKKIKFTNVAIAISGLITLMLSGLILVTIFRYIQQRRQRILELQQIDENKNRFFSIISHDLRGPVNNTLMLIQMMASEQNPPSAEESRQMMQMLESSAQKTSNLLESLLTWAKLQMNRIESKPVQLDMAKLTEDTISVMQPSADMKRINLVNRVPANVFAYADKQMITSVLRNLISNAVKFTPEDGEVTVFAKRQHSWVELSVQDKGVGITPETLPKIFSLNTKHTTRGTNNEEGSGLGLVLCREFVEKNGGHIWAESTPHKGSTFTVQLPAGNQPAVASKKAVVT
jgi:two-component system, sensor histidine kinase and response regulator